MNNIYSIVVLSIIWILLRESFSFFSLITGVLLSAGCLYFYRKYLPLNRVENIRYHRLLLYVFFLVKEIYQAGFYVIWLIIKGASADIIVLKTKITNESLRILLADSITLTPGSILLDLTDDNLKLLYLKEKNDTRDFSAVDRFLRERLERQLIKVQK